MILTEMVELFIDSRKRGVDGARRKCAERTIESYRRNLGIFLQFMTSDLKETTITQYESIKRLHIMQFLDWMEAKSKAGEWSKATIIQMLRCLKAFFRWIDRDEDCQAQELKGIQRWLPSIEKTPRRTDMPEYVDLRRFKNSFKTDTIVGYRNYVATCIMLTNGIRIGELCSLRIDHMKLNEKLLVVTGKTGVRVVGITNEIVVLLRGWMKRREKFRTAAESPFVFVSIDKTRMAEDVFAANFAKHCKDNNLPRITPHTLRHMFCTNYLRNGGGLNNLRQITGHQSLLTLEGYLHDAKIGSKHMQDELERVNILKEV